MARNLGINEKDSNAYQVEYETMKASKEQPRTKPENESKIVYRSSSGQHVDGTAFTGGFVKPGGIKFSK